MQLRSVLAILLVTVSACDAEVLDTGVDTDALTVLHDPDDPRGDDDNDGETCDPQAADIDADEWRDWVESHISLSDRYTCLLAQSIVVRFNGEVTCGERTDDGVIDDLVEEARDRCRGMDTFPTLACVAEIVREHADEFPELYEDEGNCRDVAYTYKTVFERLARHLKGDPRLSYEWWANHVLIRVTLTSCSGREYVYFIDVNLLNPGLFVPVNECAEQCAEWADASGGLPYLCEVGGSLRW